MIVTESDLKQNLKLITRPIRRSKPWSKS